VQRAPALRELARPAALTQLPVGIREELIAGAAPSFTTADTLATL